MAGGMILMGIFAAIMPVSAAMVLHGLSQIAGNGFRAILLFRNVNWTRIPFYILGGGISAALFWEVQLLPEKAWLFIFLGTVPFLGLFLNRYVVLDFSQKHGALLCGFAVCSVQLVAGVSGPLLDVFFTHTKLNRYQVVATKALTQTLSHALKIVFYAHSLDQDTLLPVHVLFTMISFSFVGTYCGGLILRKLTDYHFQKITRILILLMGAVYLIQGLLLLQA